MKRLWRLVLAALCLVSCDSHVGTDHGGSSDPILEPLMPYDRWTVSDSVARPSPGQRFEDKQPCPATSIAVEETHLEVNTTYCADTRLTQALPQALPRGSTLHWQHWHLDLWSPQETSGTFRLFVEETLLLERTFAVPGPAALATEVITVPRDLEPDAIFTLELQNHGINSWRFGHIQLDITSL